MRAPARMRLSPLSPLAALLLAALVCGAGCGRRAPAPVESGAPAALAPGQSLHLTDSLRGGPPPDGIRRSADGLLRLSREGAHQPVLCAPAPYSFRQQLRAPAGARLRLAFGIAPGGKATGPGVRFLVRVKQRGQSQELLSEVLTGRQRLDAPNWTPISRALPDGDFELELRTEPAGRADPAGSEGPTERALWVNPTVETTRGEPRPNVVLVVLDDLRADHVGCYGYARETSPFLDGLASRGVLFREAVSPATSTFPSIRGLLTSSYQFPRGAPSPNGSITPSEGGAPLRPAAMPTSLQGELRRSGYETLACVGGGYLDPTLGFDSGFDWYWSPPETPLLTDQLAIVKEQLRSRTGGPFFLLLHTYEIHHYRRAPGHGLAEFDRGYTGRLRDPKRLWEALYDDPGKLTPADRRYLQDLYDGEIRHTDRQLEAFFGWLLSRDWAKNTIVVIAADHGEAFGEHATLRHGGVPYREVTHVPLIASHADGRWQGKQVEQPVSLLDLAPTLLELVGAHKPEAMVGSSLRPLVEGEGRRPRPIFAGSQLGWMVRADPWCYVRRTGAGEEELYRTDRDVEQRRNLASACPAELARMRGELAQFAMQAADGYRLVAAGPRPTPITLELQTRDGFAYADGPFGKLSGPASAAESPGEAKRAASRVRVALPASGEPEVVLFDPVEQGAAVTVTALAGGSPVAAGRFHLGATGAAATRLPVEIGGGASASLASDRVPVPSTLRDWGLWLWQPTLAAGAGETEAKDGGLPGDVKEQLRSLGYMR